KEELAESCGVSRRAVTDWESGKVVNPPVASISEALRFAPSFFYGEDIDEVNVARVSFRALSNITQRQPGRGRIHASLVQRFVPWIDGRYTTPSPDIPSFEELTASQTEMEPSPVDAASSLRAIWSLGVGPVRDMLASLESRGVVVLGLPKAERE